MKRLAVLLVVASVFLGSCGAQGQGQDVGEMRNESRSVQPDDAKSVRAHLTMGAGELKVGGAADALMEGDFSYNVADWKPQIDYEVGGEKGDLTVEQGSGDDGRLGGGTRNEWDLRFNDHVPTDLVVEMGAGESDLDLDSLALTGLDLEMGAGENTVDLTGDYDRGFPDRRLRSGFRRQHRGRRRRGNRAGAQRGRSAGAGRRRPRQDRRRGFPEGGRSVRERRLRRFGRFPGRRRPRGRVGTINLEVV